MAERRRSDGDRMPPSAPGAQGPAPGRESLSVTGQATPRSARLASFGATGRQAPSPERPRTGASPRGRIHQGTLYDDRPPRRAGGTNGPDRAASDSPAPRKRPTQGARTGAGTRAATGPAGARPPSNPAGTRRGAGRRGGARAETGPAAGSRPRGGAPGTACAQGAGKVALMVAGAVVAALAALFGAIGSAAGGLFSRAPRRGGSRYLTHSYGGHRVSFSGASRYGSRRQSRAWSGGHDDSSVGISRAIATSACGALAVWLASALFFAAPVGADAASEARQLDIAPLDAGSLPLSTPSTAWEQGTMPYLYQIDPVWSTKPYAGGTVAINGCGPTCLTMVYIYLTGDTSYTPARMAAYADEGNYAPTGATEWRFMSEGAEGLGIDGNGIQVSSAAVTEALRAGRPVICAMGPGDFTTTGHFIVLSGIDERGMVTVHDPNSSYRSARTWALSRVLSQASACWEFTA